MVHGVRAGGEGIDFVSEAKPLKSEKGSKTTCCHTTLWLDHLPDIISPTAARIGKICSTHTYFKYHTYRSRL